MSYVSCCSQERPAAEELCPDFDGYAEVPAQLGIRVVQRDLRGNRHFVLRGADGCIGAQTWSFIDLAA